jgi:uncharacterized protein
MTESKMTKKALVTGASSGIGAAFACRLAEEGYRVTLVAREQNPLTVVCEALPGGGHSTRSCDLTDAVALKALAEHVRLEKYDVLVNNAGMGVYGPFEKRPLESQLVQVQLNCVALTSLSHAFASTAESGASLLNIATGLAPLAYPTAAVYVATKAYVLSLTQSLWYELKPRDVYAAVLLPGPVESRFHLRAGGDASDEPPSYLMQTTESVAKAGILAIRRRNRPVVVTSIPTSGLLFFTRFLPSWMMVRFMALVAASHP